MKRDEQTYWQAFPLYGHPTSEEAERDRERDQALRESGMMPDSYWTSQDSIRSGNAAHGWFHLLNSTGRILARHTPGGLCPEGSSPDGPGQKHFSAEQAAEEKEAFPDLIVVPCYCFVRRAE